MSERSLAERAELLQRWATLEERYRAGSYVGSGGPGELRTTHGMTVVVIAGHAVAHVRAGRRKRPELRTGGLADLVAQETGATALTTVGSNDGDPNWDVEHPLKLVLVSLAQAHRFALDLHGMTDEHGADICLGSGPTRDGELVELCAATADAAGLRVAVDHPSFTGAAPRTITAAAQRAGLSAVQIEIAGHRRDLRRLAARATAAWLVDLTERLMARVLSGCD